MEKKEKENDKVELRIAVVRHRQARWYEDLAQKAGMMRSRVSLNDKVMKQYVFSN